jgi:protein-S-isoprenylcysteine O-methyltransferase Ste14
VDPEGSAARPSVPQHGLMRTVVVRGLLAVLVMGVVFFAPAGTFAYWQAWVYLGLLSVVMSSALWYLVRNSPDLLERRMRMREKESAQRKVIMFSYVPSIVTFLVPGFDRRWAWSHVPLPVVVAAELVVALGYGLFVLVLRENRYASRVVEVEQGQQVTRSGPYALVRHPMYLGVTLTYLASPLALGSYWALLPAAVIIPTLVARILNEEKVLERELNGYREYKQVTKYRLFPGVW